MNWPIAIVLILVLFKQLYKLHIRHKPDAVDYLKSFIALPVDILFVVVGLLIRQIQLTPNDAAHYLGVFLIYLIISLIATLFWRLSEDCIRDKVHKRLALWLPLNFALSGTTFFLALIVLQ